MKFFYLVFLSLFFVCFNTSFGTKDSSFIIELNALENILNARNSNQLANPNANNHIYRFVLLDNKLEEFYNIKNYIFTSMYGAVTLSFLVCSPTEVSIWIKRAHSVGILRFYDSPFYSNYSTHFASLISQMFSSYSAMNRDNMIGLCITSDSPYAGMRDVSLFYHFLGFCAAGATLNFTRAVYSAVQDHKRSRSYQKTVTLSDDEVSKLSAMKKSCFSEDYVILKRTARSALYGVGLLTAACLLWSAPEYFCWEKAEDSNNMTLERSIASTFSYPEATSGTIGSEEIYNNLYNLLPSTSGGLCFGFNLNNLNGILGLGKIFPSYFCAQTGFVLLFESLIDVTNSCSSIIYKKIQNCIYKTEKK